MQVERVPFTGHARERHLMGRMSGKSGLHLVFPVGEQAVRRALATAIGVFHGMGLDSDSIEFAEIVLAEVLNNVVEHAYADRGHGIVELEAWREGGLLRMRVRDDGVPMPGEVLPAPIDHDLQIEPWKLPEGGFGWSIIRDLTQDLAYRRDATRNEVSFALNLAELSDSP